MLAHMRPDNDAEAPSTLGLSLLLVVLALVLLGSSWGQLRPAGSLEARLKLDHPLRVGYALEPPYAFLDAEGELRGESVEVLDAVLSELGIRARNHIRLDFGSLLEELEAGRIDLIAGGMFVTPERSGRVRFTRPTAVVGAALLARPDRGGDGRLAVLQGSVEAAHAQRFGYPPQRVLELPDARTALAALDIGEVEAFALSAPSLRWLMSRNGRREGQELILQPGLPPGLPAFALRPEDAWLAERMDKALADLLGSPRHRALVAPYGFGADEIEPALDREPQ